MSEVKHINLERLQYFAQQLYAKIDSKKANASDLATVLLQIGSAAIEANPSSGTPAIPATGIYKAIDDGDARALQLAKDYADLAIANLINAAPETLNTLKKLADALGNDENFSVTILNRINNIETVIGTENGVSGPTGIYAKIKEVADSIPAQQQVDLSNYVTNDTYNQGIQEVQNTLQTKADTDHNHDNAYAPVTHTHDTTGMAYTNELYPNITTVENALDELLYFGPQVKSFMAIPAFGDYEVGHSITNPVFTWEYNKDITLQTLTGCTIEPQDRAKTYIGIVNSNKTFTLNATDNKGNSCYRNGSYSFKHKRYFGVSSAPSMYDSAFILSLENKEFASSKVKSKFTLNAGKNQYLYYCFPESFGVPTFNVGGFDGGFELADTISFTNASGHTESFVIYKSVNVNLGQQTISVS